MKKNRKATILLCVIILEFAAAAYDALFNGFRVIKPIDFSSYTFQAADLPLMAATLVLVSYIVYLVLSSVIKGFRNQKKGQIQVTRELNPRFGYFGFFGFFGFMGIPAYILRQQVWPFFFFVFFGFFGFFYEAKLSSTLMDERFKEEQLKAQLISYKTGFGLLWLVTWFTAIVGSHLNTDSVAVIFTVSSSLIIALVLFLSNYLLYKYDTEEVE